MRCPDSGEGLARPREGEKSCEGRGTASAKVLRPRRDSVLRPMWLVQRGVGSDTGEVGRGQAGVCPESTAEGFKLE